MYIAFIEINTFDEIQKYKFVFVFVFSDKNSNSCMDNFLTTK